MIKDWFYDKLKSDIGVKRFEHSLRVMEESKKLALRHGCPIEKASLAGLLHDCGKLQGNINLLKLADDFDIILDGVMRNNPELIHCAIGPAIAEREYNVKDKDVLNAIRYHTTGRENMTLLEKIIYIADLIEPGRDFDGVEDLRKLAYDDIDKCMLLALDNTIKYVIQKQMLIHLDSIRARNYLLIQKNLE